MQRNKPDTTTWLSMGPSGRTLESMEKGRDHRGHQMSHDPPQRASF